MSEDTADRVTDVFEQFARDLGLYTLAGFVPAVTGVVALIVFTHVFAPSAYGRYALTLSVVTLFGTACYGWIDQAVVRFEPHVEPSVLLGNVVWLLGGIGTAAGILALVGYVFVTPLLGPFAPFLLAGVAVAVTQGSFYVLRALLRVRLESRSVVGYEVFRSVGGLALALVLALVILDGIVGWLWGTAIASGITVGLLVFRLVFGARSIRFDPTFARRMARYGFPLAGWLAGMMLLNFADRVLIELLRGSEAVGIYASNYSVVHYGLGLVFTPIIISAEPILMNLWDENNEAEVAATITDMTRYLLIVGVPAVIGAAAFHRVLSNLLLGASYAQGAVVIPIIAVGLLIWNAAIIGQKGIEVEERTTILLYGIALAVVVNVVVNVPLIIRFGYVGAAVATLMSFVLYAGFILVVTRRYIPWRLPLRSIRNIAVASLGLLVPYATLFVLGRDSLGTLIIASVIGGSAYLAIAYRIGELKSDELTKLKRLLST